MIHLHIERPKAKAIVEKLSKMWLGDHPASELVVVLRDALKEEPQEVEPSREDVDTGATLARLNGEIRTRRAVSESLVESLGAKEDELDAAAAALKVMTEDRDEYEAQAADLRRSLRSTEIQRDDARRDLEACRAGRLV